MLLVSVFAVVIINISVARTSDRTVTALAAAVIIPTIMVAGVAVVIMEGVLIQRQTLEAVSITSIGPPKN